MYMRSKTFPSCTGRLHSGIREDISDAGSRDGDRFSFWDPRKGLAHINLSVADQVIPCSFRDPCYPYFSRIAPGSQEPDCIQIPLKERDYLIDFESIGGDSAGVKLIVCILSEYPTAAVAADSFYKTLIAFAAKI